MTESVTDKRDGATPVMSRAGGVPVPLPRSLNGITQATRAPSSKGHPRSRRVMVKQRRLNTVHAPGTQTTKTDTATQTAPQPQHPTPQPETNFTHVHTLKKTSLTKSKANSNINDYWLITLMFKRNVNPHFF